MIPRALVEKECHAGRAMKNQVIGVDLGTREVQGHWHTFSLSPYMYIYICICMNISDSQEGSQNLRRGTNTLQMQ